MPAAPESTLLTVEELAEIVRLHPKSIYRLVEKGKLPHIRIGRSIRFNLDVIQRLKKGEENV